VALTGTVFAGAASFGAGAVQIGAVTVTGVLFSDGDSFGSGAVDGGIAVVSDSLPKIIAPVSVGRLMVN
jgi:hypothetical protein